MVVAVWLPQEWAWHAVLLVIGLASLSHGSHGEYSAGPQLLPLCVLMILLFLLEAKAFILSCSGNNCIFFVYCLNTQEAYVDTI